MGITDEERISKIDTSLYDVIVFDEIYLVGIQKLVNIEQFCLNNPDKIIIATGDTSQLPPINDYTNRKIYSIYADECINLIFPYEVFLFENKRLKSEEDKIRLKQLKNEIFDERIDLITTIKKHFKFTTDITKSFKNIAYKNDTCAEVNKHIRKK